LRSASALPPAGSSAGARKDTAMPHVVTDNCHLCRFTDCVTVCPVECFHSDEERTYIDPEVCIDCGACIPACPVRAIYDTLDPARGPAALDRYQRGAVSRPFPVISDKQDPLPGAEERKAALGY